MPSSLDERRFEAKCSCKYAAHVLPSQTGHRVGILMHFVVCDTCDSVPASTTSEHARKLDYAMLGADASQLP